MNLKKLQKTIEQIGSSLSPEGDWMPALLLESPKEFSIFGFVGDSLKNDFTKNATAEQMVKLISTFKPHTACFITTSWTLPWQKDKDRRRIEEFVSGRLKVSDQPDRIEIVSAYCYGDKGENEGEVLMMGYIKRSPKNPPKITHWKTIEGKDDMSAGGRFPEAIKEGFKQAKGK